MQTLDEAHAVLEGGIRGQLQDVGDGVSVVAHDGSIGGARICGIFSPQEGGRVLDADVVALNRVRGLNALGRDKAAQRALPAPWLAKLVPQVFPQLVDLINDPLLGAINLGYGKQHDRNSLAKRRVFFGNTPKSRLVNTIRKARFRWIEHEDLPGDRGNTPAAG